MLASLAAYSCTIRKEGQATCIQGVEQRYIYKKYKITGMGIYKEITELNVFYKS
jgi:hypothetical protein